MRKVLQTGTKSWSIAGRTGRKHGVEVSRIIPTPRNRRRRLQRQSFQSVITPSNPSIITLTISFPQSRGCSEKLEGHVVCQHSSENVVGLSPLPAQRLLCRVVPHAGYVLPQPCASSLLVGMSVSQTCSTCQLPESALGRRHARPVPRRATAAAGGGTLIFWQLIKQLKQQQEQQKQEPSQPQRLRY